jgi:hypothetical protein
VYGMRHPDPEWLNRKRPPLLERNPVAFWRGVSFVLAAAVIYLLAR